MVETPRAILRAEEIAGSHPRLALFVMGTNDLVKDMRARHTPMRLPMIAALGIGMLAARAYGLAPEQVLAGNGSDAFDADILAGVNGRWYVRPDLALVAGYEFGKITTVNVGVRYSF